MLVRFFYVNIIYICRPFNSMIDNPKINSTIALGLYVFCLLLMLVSFIPISREVRIELGLLFNFIYLIALIFSIITFAQLKYVFGKNKYIYGVKAGLPFIHLIIFIIAIIKALT